MADITARLIWYRLGEIADCARAYVLDEDVDILDILFAFWVIVAAVILLIVYGVEWLAKRSRTFQKGVVTGDAARWNALRRQHSFFLDPAERNQQQQQQQQQQQETVVEAIVKEQSIKDERVTPMAAAASTAKSNGGGDRTDGPSSGCHWLNRLMTWMYLNYSRPPQWLNDWLITLNDELTRRARGQKNGLLLVRILPGALPPKMLSLACEPGEDTRCLFLRSRVTVAELGFRAKLTPSGRECDITIKDLLGELSIATKMARTSEGLRVVIKFVERPRMEITVNQPLDTTASPPLDVDWIRRQVLRALEEAVTEVSFPGPQLANKGDSRGVDAVLAEALASSSTSPSAPLAPQVRVTIAQEDEEPAERVIIARQSRTTAAAPRGEAQEVKRRSKSPREKSHDGSRPTSSSSIPRFFSGQRTFGGRSSASNGSVSRPLVLSTSTTPSPDPPKEEQQLLVQGSHNPPQQQQQQQQQQPRSASPSPRLPSPMRSPIRGLAKGQSVLAKIIKATGLTAHKSRSRERAYYCIVEMDEPYQRHTTSTVGGSSSAFWDQGFVLELNTNSQRITFAVFDADPEKGGSVGQTVVPLTDLMAHPSSRQIIPLSESSRHRSKDREVGGPQASITVEFLFLVPSPATNGEAPVVAKATTVTATPRPTPARLPTSSSSISASSSSPSSAGAVPSQASPPQRPVTSRDLANFMAPPEMAASMSKGASEIRERPAAVQPQPSAPPNHRLHLNIPSVASDTNHVEAITVERGRQPEPEKHVPAKRSRSFASRLRKTFGPKNKERSKSADRLSPKAADPSGTNGAVSGASSHSSLQRSKSTGLSGSFRRLFSGRRTKRQSGSDGAVPFLAPSGPPLMSGAATLPRPATQHQPVDDASSYSSEGFNFQSRESLL